MDWLGNNVKTFKVKGITIIANRNNGMVIGLDRVLLISQFVTN